MVSNISFTSTFKVSSRHNNFNTYQKFQYKAQEECDRYEGRMKIEFVPGEKETDYFETECTLVAPDTRDLSLQEYCKMHGIVYKKIGNEKINSLPQLERRIIQFDEGSGKRLVKINSEKLSELIKKQTTNINDCKARYDNYFKDYVDFIFKSGDDFLTTKVVIFSNSGVTKDALEQLEKDGKDSLEEKQIYIGFSNESQKPDECMYFGFCDLGMKSIPVYTDEISFKILQKLGIVEEEN